MEIIPIILSALALVGVLILIILILKKSKHEVDHSNDLQFGALSEQIKNFKNDLSQDIKIQIKDEMIALKDNQIQTNKDSSERLVQFQTGINESMEKKFVGLNELVQNKLLEINKQVNERLEGGFKNTNETFTNVMERLAKIDEAQKNIETLSGEVVSLKNVLENNQARGQYGEFQLESILHNVFGDTVGLFEMQYTIKNGSTEENTIRPDAVVFLPDPYKMVCIDSKFPFQNYQRLYASELSDAEKLSFEKSFKSDIKKHIDTIAGKYILKGKTIEQAIMFIPNDGIFAYIHVTFQDLIEYAQKKHVNVTSPATLQAVLASIQIFRINYERNKNAQFITEQLNLLSRDFRKFGEDWSKLSKNLSSVQNAKESLDERVNYIDKKFNKIAMSGGLNEIGKKDDEIKKVDTNDNN